MSATRGIGVVVALVVYGFLIESAMGWTAVFGLISILIFSPIFGIPWVAEPSARVPKTFQWSAFKVFFRVECLGSFTLRRVLEPQDVSIYLFKCLKTLTFCFEILEKLFHQNISFRICWEGVCTRWHLEMTKYFTILCPTYQILGLVCWTDVGRIFGHFKMSGMGVPTRRSTTFFSGL